MIFTPTVGRLALRARSRSHIPKTETIVVIPIYSMYLVYRSLQLAGPKSPAAVSNGTVGAERIQG